VNVIVSLYVSALKVVFSVYIIERVVVVPVVFDEELRALIICAEVESGQEAPFT
jgi:hypothetical protein